MCRRSSARAWRSKEAVCTTTALSSYLWQTVRREWTVCVAQQQWPLCFSSCALGIVINHYRVKLNLHFNVFHFLSHGCPLSQCYAIQTVYPVCFLSHPRQSHKRNDGDNERTRTSRHNQLPALGRTAYWHRVIILEPDGHPAARLSILQCPAPLNPRVNIIRGLAVPPRPAPRAHQDGRGPSPGRHGS